ncbi:autotransporter outer membrane beta-barrel domain-containing protein [Cerasicoccus frondis]|uniref:autotransporter outer membrane beta-barrel domain-containing protein n=1 Tax=Cerasicoccus frondis TaxID=490090 RepID=UPI002852C3E6|nr:autotransporter outer membrane beta-barrel domain-containing protein [Cerasicoccus frondis]
MRNASCLLAIFSITTSAFGQILNIAVVSEIELAADGGGDAGPSIDRSVTTDVSVAAGDIPDTGVLLTSTGGTGAGGSENQSSGDGGVGGAISLGISAAISNISTAWTGYGLNLQSTGGVSGGNVYGSTFGDRGDTATGTGGDGGDIVVTLDQGGSISLKMPNGVQAANPNFAVSATSTGGDGANGGGVDSVIDIFSGYAGPGGMGGNGGSVSLDVDGNISTDYENNAGIYLLSVGGNGGDGGLDGDTVDDDPGGGGNGGAASSVTLTVDKDGSVATNADNAPAVLLSAEGGTGGVGAIGGGTGVNFTDRFDSAGGNGAATDDDVVKLTNHGNITTQGIYSPAVTLQSVGGNGGDSRNVDGDPGGDGGAGGAVEATNTGTISTQGEFGFGIFAQSVGGTGGNGADSAFVGGDGGSAGQGGTISIDNSGSITTAGQGAIAIVAQSIGGGNSSDALTQSKFTLVDQPDSNNGGQAGSAWFPFASRGGDGGTGGDSSTVTVTHSGTISTKGDLASGIYAQAVGGGGATGASDNGANIELNVSSGGSGGSGGVGGDVTIETTDSASTITTTGATSPAITAQSIGGGGGNGGALTTGGGGVALDFSINVGGDGGQGNTGGVITVTNASSLTTSGVESPGIYGHSVGGGGGSGGSATSYTALITGKESAELPALAVTNNVGGNAGSGGAGGDIALTNTGTIVTYDSASSGVQGSSVGGGGGTGGNATLNSYSAGANDEVRLSASLGGSGGDGGVGGKITLSNSSSIETYGFGSEGLAALSVGGGGGDGGFGHAETTIKIPFEMLNQYVNSSSLQSILSLGQSLATLAKGTNVSAVLALGGSGGSGGLGGDLSLTNSGSILTANMDAPGISARSIGGGGGNAGGSSAASAESVSLNYSVGGTGGEGGHGGKITIHNEQGATVNTHADGSHGIEAKSVGGGGGKGGASSAEATGSLVKAVGKAALKAVPKSLGRLLLSVVAPTNIRSGSFAEDFWEKFEVTVSANVSIGGNGNVGGDGGKVSVTNDGVIHTRGDVAHGILAHSIGGGGGEGGAAVAQGGNVFNADFLTGGAGGAAGDGGKVEITNDESVFTDGNSSFGLFGQSVGGGGGIAGVGSDESSWSITAKFTLGGNHGDGSTGSSGLGGSVDINHNGHVRTIGEESHAIVAQSIGAGGGLSFLNHGNATSDDEYDAGFESVLHEVISELESVGVDFEQVFEYLTGNYQNASGTYTLKLGGTSDSTGNGGDVSVSQQGTIHTNGANAFGVFAQSIGGGGGFFTDGVGTSFDVTIDSESSVLGGSGDGGSVDIQLSDGAAITTEGDGSIAIFAQSIGGGGGYTGAVTDQSSGATFDNFLSDSTLGSGVGGAVTIESAPDASMSITTHGKNAHGIYAQSLSGGGVAVGTTDGVILPTGYNGDSRSGNFGEASAGVSINLKGSIAVTGDGSVGIYAQSGYQSVEGTIDTTAPSGPITVQFDGSIHGGDGNGAGIWLDGGTDNNILFRGGTLQAKSGVAIRTTDTGAASVMNLGTIIGNLDFSGQTGFINGRSGAFYPGSSVQLSYGEFNNQGTLNVGGVNEISTTSLQGDFRQDTGVWNVEIDPANNQNDQLQVSGTANIESGLRPVIIGSGQGLNGTYTFLTSPETYVAFDAVEDSLVVNWNVTTSGTETSLSIESVDFMGSSSHQASKLTQNEQHVAKYLQSIWANGNSADLDVAIASILNAQTSAQLASGLQSLSPEAHAVSPAVAPSTAARHHTTLHSIPVFVGNTTQLTEGTGFYMRGDYADLQYDKNNQISGYSEDEWRYQVGGQQHVGNNFFLGGGFIYGNQNITSEGGGFSGDGNSYTGGLVAKKLIGENWLVGASLAYTYSETDFQRRVAGLVAESHQVSHIVSSRLRAAYNIPFSNWYLRPAMNIDLVNVDVPAYSETGAGGLNQHFESQDDFQAGFSPELEAGMRIDLDGAYLRPYAKIGVSAWTDSTWETRSRVSGAVAGGVLVSEFEYDQFFGRAEAGIEFVTDGGWEVRAQYDNNFSENLLVNAVSLRMGFRF